MNNYSEKKHRSTVISLVAVLLVVFVFVFMLFYHREFNKTGWGPPLLAIFCFSIFLLLAFINRIDPIDALAEPLTNNPNELINKHIEIIWVEAKRQSTTARLCFNLGFASILILNGVILSLLFTDKNPIDFNASLFLRVAMIFFGNIFAYFMFQASKRYELRRKELLCEISIYQNKKLILSTFEKNNNYLALHVLDALMKLPPCGDASLNLGQDVNAFSDYIKTTNEFVALIKNVIENKSDPSSDRPSA